MLILNCGRFVVQRNCLNFWLQGRKNVSSHIKPYQFIFQHRNITEQSLLLHGTCRKLSIFSSCSRTYPIRSNLKTVTFRTNFYCLFRTSPSRNIHPAVWIVVRPVLKFVAVITGRGIRKWWRNLPIDKKKYFIDEIKANRKKIGIVLSLILCMSVGYYLSHLELTPITKRKRFMAFNPKQIEKINEFELQQLMEQLSQQILPPTHPASKRVERVVRRIIAANTDVKEFENKKFGISVIGNSVENAFVLPIGHVFVFAGMLNLCTNDDQLGTVLSHEIAHSILNHGAENVSFTHLLDLFSIIMIAAIWAVIPIDSLSLLMHWLFQKSVEIFLQLPYNRTLEIEADEVGLKLAAKACFDVRESSAFWSKMAFLKKTFGNAPEIEFLSTHPSHESRSEYLDKRMDEAMKLRASCGCPRLNYKDPRQDINNISKALEIARKQYLEENKKPVIVFKV